jgi:hypothetical protein
VRTTPPPWAFPGASARLEQRIVETERRLEALRERR